MNDYLRGGNRGRGGVGGGCLLAPLLDRNCIARQLSITTTRLFLTNPPGARRIMAETNLI